LVEQFIRNEKVASSIPAIGTSIRSPVGDCLKKPTFRKDRGFFFVPARPARYMAGCSRAPNRPRISAARKAIAGLSALMVRNPSQAAGGPIKKQLLIIYLCGLFSNAVAQDSLEPCRDVQSDRYRAGVNKVIDKAVGRPSSLQLTTYPSFDAESGLRLVGAELYFVQFRSSFWGAAHPDFRDGRSRMDFTKPRIRVSTSRAPLSMTIARRIESAYAKAIAKAAKNDLIGMDGDFYIFSTSEHSCALAWSPEPQTRNGRLVALMDWLGRHTTYSNSVDLGSSEKAIEILLNTIE